jgi:plasmid stabilization system protein ParE
VPKKYLVEFTKTAESDIYRTWADIAADNPIAADRWLGNVRKTAGRLETFPLAFEVIPESKGWGIEYRQKLFGNYRIIYRVDDERVIVLRVIHGARLLDLSMFLR